MTHDYKRNGTTTLFAALNTLDGTVIAETKQRHRHQEWLAFLKRLDSETPKHLGLHIICDNYATHKHPKVKAWLEKHNRIHIHFTPTSSSWLNMVERFFRDITDKRIRRGVFKSVPDLETAIHAYIAGHNEAPKPFIKPPTSWRRLCAQGRRSMIHVFRADYTSLWNSKRPKGVVRTIAYDRHAQWDDPVGAGASRPGKPSTSKPQAPRVAAPAAMPKIGR